ncbi:MAG TPA: ABC transporter permease, partial [Methylomirabilota bacterium]|nr:ABC transporter permease [Methylomirabilota bacterium]
MTASNEPFPSTPRSDRAAGSSLAAKPPPDGVPPPRSSQPRRLAAALYRRPRAQLAILLSAPLGWLLIAYIGALVLLFVSAFWRLDPFSGDIVTEPTLQNFEELLTTDIYRTVAIRTIGIAALVTVTDVILAFPIAYFMARVASPRTRALLVVSILLPLWSGYLVKVYAWRLILSEEGLLNWVLAPFGLKGPGYGEVAVWLVMSYLWLPYMIIPIFAGLERIPNSVLEASGDLGARASTTFRR